TETQSVTTSGGLFAVLLGSSNPIPDAVFQSSERWLGIAVSPDPEMPRQRLVSVGYAYRVNSVDSALGGTIKTKVTIGPNTNTGADAFVAGYRNGVTGNYSVVDGGSGDTASGDYSAVGGGFLNIASGIGATIAGGGFNRAKGQYSTVGGGGGSSAADSNSASGERATVSGGRRNVASQIFATVSGGDNNIVSGDAGTIAGGLDNVSSGTASTVGGGALNKARGQFSVVGGGGSFFALIDSNSALGDWSTVGGGSRNVAADSFSTVAGGQTNRALKRYATIGGGSLNRASGDYSTVPGGILNRADGNYSFAAGRRAVASHTGSFVWADSTNADFASTDANQFLIRASGGVGIGTNSPSQMLDVADNISIRGTHLVYNSANGVIDWGPSGDLFFRRLSTQGDISAYSEKMVIKDNGNVGIGTSAPAALLHVNGTAGNNTGVWSNLSDRRLKKEIEPISGALASVLQLKGVTFRWKNEGMDQEFGRVRGLIAQDVEQVIPEWVKTDPNGYKRLEPIGVDALLIEAIKEQHKQIEELKKELHELKNRRTRAQLED
ncbi:MAG TPA: tail fiber domain-containing protein, partial [Verrucomicrobiae bacterium]|nr:tail fiber domain-containing protein [Verrucomicrobiae bacterium]